MVGLNACFIHPFYNCHHQVSSLHWDQNETFAQFAGDHCLLSDGYSSILKKLGEDIDIRLQTEVVTVDYTGDEVVVRTKGGEEHRAPKVMVF